jgi:hypothetical protein
MRAARSCDHGRQELEQHRGSDGTEPAPNEAKPVGGQQNLFE